MPLLDRIAFHGGSIQRVGALGSSRRRLAEHPFPGIELEGELDRAVVEIDEAAAVVAPADVRRCRAAWLRARPARARVLEIGERAGVLGVVGRARSRCRWRPLPTLLPAPRSAARGSS